MARRRRRGFDPLVDGTRLAIAAILLLALATGDIRDFPRRALAIVIYTAIAAVVVGGLALSVFVALMLIKKRRRADERWIGVAGGPSRKIETARTEPECPTASIREALEAIDWFQFEKFCSEVLRSEGFVVERRGGAHPDGGVDLEATKDGVRTLVQCKHWRTWDVKEPTVRELLGSMVDFGASSGAIYTLKGWTIPAAAFAGRHGIILADGGDLSFRAQKSLDSSTLDRLLDSSVHHCPKCEGPMVLKTGAFSRFWSCARFPACRGKLKHTGAR